MKIFLLSIILLSFPIITHASGIQVSPSKLEFSVSKKTERKKLIVVNPTVDAQVFRAYFESPNMGTEVSPASFILEAGARREIEVEVDPKKIETADGIVTTTLAVVSSPLVEDSVTIGAGVKVKVNVTKKTETGTVSIPGLVTGLTASLLVCILYFWRFRKRLIH